MDTLVGTLERGSCKAEIYEAALPGQFSIRYYGGDGKLLAEDPLSGVSSYKQREEEIVARLEEFCRGGQPASGDLSDSGEY